MADSLMINVKEGFDVKQLEQKLGDTYRAKGFTVNTMSLENGFRMKFDKGCGGINMLLGMGKGITAMCTVMNNNLIVNYSDADWTGKIIGLVAGWFLCWIPCVTAIIGCVGQSSLPKEINNDITMLANS